MHRKSCCRHVVAVVVAGEEQRDPRLQQPAGCDPDKAGQSSERRGHVGVTVDAHQDHSRQEDTAAWTHQNVRFLFTIYICILYLPPGVMSGPGVSDHRLLTTQLLVVLSSAHSTQCSQTINYFIAWDPLDLFPSIFPVIT